MAQKSGLIQGTLDMLILRVLARGDFHGWGITQRMEQVSKNALRVEEGSLYPALYRMEDKGWIKGEWRQTEKGQRAKYYSLTNKGRKQLEAAMQSWDHMTSLVAQVLESA